MLLNNRLIQQIFYSVLTIVCIIIFVFILSSVAIHYFPETGSLNLFFEKTYYYWLIWRIGLYVFCGLMLYKLRQKKYNEQWNRFFVQYFLLIGFAEIVNLGKYFL
ncbi:hypothetical protein CEP48_00285 [Mergibacter septicus]|uniref:Uncharacterized protein n=1 Tax=Mergibacter septicus TaxID=221402 RepID=A0A8E3MEW8_9PAST|nr:hypothetical protein CEP47_00285 [Mergibacter septicus]QDJ13972.1 hypothetical protein CEP48_00285 [Mergibacter septicus]